jgi:hypothetical protein
MTQDEIIEMAKQSGAMFDHKMNFPFLKAKERLIRIMGTFDLATGHAETFDELLDSLESELRDVLGHYREALSQTEQDVVGGLVLKQGPDYERGFVDGMQKQMQSSVDKAVNAMSQRTWVGLTGEEIDKAWRSVDYTVPWEQHRIDIAQAIEQALKEKNV